MCTRTVIDRRTFAASALSLLTLGANRAAAADMPGIPEARAVGKARLNALLLPVFDLVLYAPGGLWRDSRPFGLTVDILRPLKGRLMARHAIDEIRRNPRAPRERLGPWQANLENTLVDVAAGQRAFVLRDASAATRFFVDGRELGRVDDPQFTEAFFAICLGPDTSMPGLRRGLLSL